jgi:hypothetical protein
MNKVVEIFKAWKISYNPTNEQNELAAARLEICSKCEHKVHNETLNLTLCGLCGCPLNKKAFSPKTKACDIGKWNIVESKYLK